MTAAPAPIERATPPKLLLDANVFRGIAERSLESFRERLVRVAEHRPPLLWVSPVTFHEVVSHIRVEDADRYAHFRDAVRWMEKLCGNEGLAEELAWVLRRANFERALPHDAEDTAALNRVRRRLIRCETFADVPAALLADIAAVRAHDWGTIETWTNHRKATHEAVKNAKPKPGEPTVTAEVVVPQLLVAVSRTHAAADLPLLGPFRPVAEQIELQREMIAFELSHLLKADGPQGYKAEKHVGDYNDGWLLAYLAIGYTLVTSDGGIRTACQMGGCKEPRILDVAAALDIAEAWLASNRAPGT